MNNGLDIFSELNNAVLDLQGSGYQNCSRPLKALGRLLKRPELEDANQSLIEGVDFEAFIKASENTHGSMAGSAQLAWPDDKRQELGLILLLLKKIGDDPDYAEDFSHTYFYSRSGFTTSIRAMTAQLIIPFLRDYKNYVVNKGNMDMKVHTPKSKKIFIVHGHDGEARETVARYLGKIGFEPIILHEQANLGKTVIEKVETNSDVGFAIVLLTPDDEGKAKSATALEPRVRQNVLIELGYFIGRLSRSNVCALKKGAVEIPSDFAGVVWETMDSNDGWKRILARELEAAGYMIDWNKVML